MYLAQELWPLGRMVTELEAGLTEIRATGNRVVPAQSVYLPDKGTLLFLREAWQDGIPEYPGNTTIEV